MTKDCGCQWKRGGEGTRPYIKCKLKLKKKNHLRRNRQNERKENLRNFVLFFQNPIVTVQGT